MILIMDFTNNDSNDIKVNEAVRKYNSLGRKLTYSDYEIINDGNRYELIDGVIFLMSAPSAAHQSILRELTVQLSVFLKGKQCMVFPAPFDVCLNGLGDKDETVVQPDIIVICDKKIIDAKRCNGVPDMVIEILSPSTSKIDLLTKLKKYQTAGVCEYWIVDPDSKSVNVHILEKGKYVIHLYECNDDIAVNVLTGCVINLSEIFDYSFFS